MSRLKNMFDKVKAKMKSNKPLTFGIIGMLVFTTIIFITQGIYYLVGHSGFTITLSLIITAVVLAIVALVITIVLKLLKKIPDIFTWAFIFGFPILLYSFVVPFSASIPTIFMLLLLAFFFGKYLYLALKPKALDSNKRKMFNRTIATSTLVIILLVTSWFTWTGSPRVDERVLNQVQTTLENPIENVQYDFGEMTYHSNATENEISTPTVDATGYMTSWSKTRTKSVGFGPENLPLNAHVWYPVTNEKSPLVLIVHGNHMMHDTSDDGYGYLGELLAQKGYIVASIDQNFLNVSPYDDKMIFTALNNENPARALLLLEHIKLFDGWNQEQSSQFFNKIDMDNIALVGHSRGNEAISIAAFYNHLGISPIGDSRKFDYHFNIKSLISLGGTDGQYQPGGERLALENINYLALQGAHDMDVNSFSGANQFDRISFTDGKDYLKSTVLISGANHGQFNRKWGRGDGAGLSNYFFNTKQLISRMEQEKIAEVLMSSFLDTTLKGQKEYELIFQDLDYASSWLPALDYRSNYETSKELKLLDKNSQDLTRGFAQTQIDATGFSRWERKLLPFKNNNSNIHAHYLEWEKGNVAPSYTLKLSNTTTRDTQQINFALSDARKPEKDLPELAFDFLLVDKKGEKVQLSASELGGLGKQVNAELLKWPFNKVGTAYEPILSTMTITNELIEKKSKSFTFNDLETITLIFDDKNDGSIYIERVSLQ